MRYSLGLLAAAACASSCGGADPTTQPTAVQSSAIQGGTTDSTHTFAVGVVQAADIQNDMVAYCTGVLLAPNLVATARHCVAELSSTTIDCTTSTFGSLMPASDVYVTTQTIIDPHDLDDPAEFDTVSSIIVPTGASQTSVCGDDIALLVLSSSITLPQYVVPTISPPMTDSQYEPTVTAIGYGIDTPTDTNGASAGTRRIKENVALQCIPDDPNPSESSLDCFATDPQQAPTYMTATEFMSGDSTCEGDSGSGAFEQSNFDQGKWVAFGILSRGGTSNDGTTCIQPIYSRFDAWGSLLVSAAKQAAAAGGYAVPAWASGGTDAGAATGGSSSSGDGGASAAGNGGGGGSSSGGGDEEAGGGSIEGGSPAGESSGGPTVASSGGSGGCAVSGAAGLAPAPFGSATLWGLGLAGLAAGRRRGRKRSEHLSAS